MQTRTWVWGVACVSCGLLGTPSSLDAQPPARTAPRPVQHGFVDKVFQDDAGTHKYVVFVPAAYRPDRKWPVLLSLHGAGECGTDGRRQLTVGLGPMLAKQAETFPCVVVFPQCENIEDRILTRWQAGSPDADRALKILEQVNKDYHGDPQRQFLTGWSMGGFGAWSLGAAEASRWKAVAPLAGGGDPATAEKLKGVRLWAFHGELDPSVHASKSQEMIDAIKAAGGDPKFTLVPAGDHDVWKTAYEGTALVDWMLDRKTPTRATTPAPVQHQALRPSPTEIPFVPAVKISRAAYVRMGNDMLKEMGRTVPHVIPPGAMSGRLNDIFSGTTASGISFSVQFSGISYSGQVTRAQVQAYAKDRLNVKLALSNVVLSIGSTYVSGGSRSATAGPIGIYFGHRYPVWLSFDVTPYVERGRLRLRHVGTQFQIPPDNYSVSGPAGVSTRGLGMTSERVSSGLISGLYGSRGRIESEVGAVVPSLLAQLEQRLDLTQLNEVSGSVWPLPVYQPRVRSFVQDVATDKHGVTIVMGMEVAAFDHAKAPKQAPWAKFGGLKTADLPQGTNLQVGLTPAALEPLSELLVNADMARIHVLDTPVRSLAAFMDRQALAEAIPDLKRFSDSAQLRAVLVLSKPLSVATARGTADLKLSVPELKIALAVKPEGSEKEWTPYADLVMSIQQGAEPKVVSPTLTGRALLLEWDENAEYTASAKFAEGFTPENSEIDVEKLKGMFVTAWQEFTSGGPAAVTRVKDVDLGYSKLRLQGAEWQAPYLATTFAPASVTLQNHSDTDFVYRTKGPASPWSTPYKLAPGESARFDIAYPLLFRRESQSGQELYTLPAGSVSELRVPEKGGPPRVFLARETPTK